MTGDDPKFFEARLHKTGEPRNGDVRDAYQRDRARILHSSAFRRLQGKTQVMGVGEGDFHRTRLTHSIECAQIGGSLLAKVRTLGDVPEQLKPWLPCRALIEAACFAHDIGHPPFGHAGEKALDKQMKEWGGFEGNGHTLRILTRLEKYCQDGWGIDPTRRLILAVLKYPVAYSQFNRKNYKENPPKCYLDSENEIVERALEGFSHEDRSALGRRGKDDKPLYRTFDCSLMELADDIAYGVHDIEDIVGRKLADREDIKDKINKAFNSLPQSLYNDLDPANIVDNLFKDSYKRKQAISGLVNFFISSIIIKEIHVFEHPLLKFVPALPLNHGEFLANLKDIAYELVIKKAQVQQLEHRGQLIVRELFEVLSENPKKLIPAGSGLAEEDKARSVCDYVAGMTDAYAEKIYRRLFVPGYGSSGDEL